MKVAIVPVGNSKGIRIPKALLEQCGFRGDAELTVEENRLVISPRSGVRQGWDEAFRKMSARHDDRLIETPPSAFDEEEWEW